jgi:hypothetical protein
MASRLTRRTLLDGQLAGETIYTYCDADSFADARDAGRV